MSADISCPPFTYTVPCPLPTVSCTVSSLILLSNCTFYCRTIRCLLYVFRFPSSAVHCRRCTLSTVHYPLLSAVHKTLYVHGLLSTILNKYSLLSSTASVVLCLLHNPCPLSAVLCFFPMSAALCSPLALHCPLSSVRILLSAVHRPLSSVRFLLSAVHGLLSSVRFLPSAVLVNCPLSAFYCLLNTVHCPLSSVHCPRSTVVCPLSTACCTRSTVLCPLSTVLCPLSTACYTRSTVLCPLSAVLCPLSTVC